MKRAILPWFMTALVGFISTFLPSAAHTDMLTVTNADDKGAGSLRDTINKAKSGDTILFAPGLSGKTITLTSDQLTIKKSLDIEGPGPDLLAISGNDKNRVFDISEGLTVTITGLTITHGRVERNDKGGGGIFNAGSVVALTDDQFINNVAVPNGGAICNQVGGNLTVTNCTFAGNQAVATDPLVYAEGGAIWNAYHGADTTVIGCTFTGNQAIGASGGVVRNGTLYNFVGAANGGAIHNEGIGGQPDTLIVMNSTFTGNQAIAGSGGSGASGSLVDVATGGGIANDDAGIVVIDGCTFSYNQAIGGSNASGGNSRIGNGSGGAIITEGTTTITNSTFDHNEALGGSNNTGGEGASLIGTGTGGAISNLNFDVQANLNVSNCTFSNNRAVGGSGNTGGIIVGSGLGGGVANRAGAEATITGSMFLGNQAVGGDGGVGGNGGNGFGGGLFNDGVSNIEVLGCTITGNQAIGGASGAGGSAGSGVGGGVYLASGGVACFDALTSVITNTASTSDNDVFGIFTLCP